MTTAPELIAEAAQKGLVLSLEGESIRVRGPIHRVGPEVEALIEEIRSRKAEVVQALKSRILAVLICSRILETEIWLALDDSSDPSDGLAMYYPEELPILKTKSLEELREIHKVKLAFPGCRVRAAED